MINSEPVQEVVALLEQGIKTYHQVYKQKAEFYGLTVAQARILQVLKEKEPQTVSEVSKKLNVSAAFVSNTMDELQKKSLLVRERDDKDRRIVWHVLTEIGRGIANDLQHFQTRHFVGCISNANERRIKEIKEKLQGFIHDLETDKSKGEQ